MCLFRNYIYVSLQAILISLNILVVLLARNGIFQQKLLNLVLNECILIAGSKNTPMTPLRKFLDQGCSINEFLRNVFELGPPVMLDAATLKTMKISCFERHLYNSAAFKARTKARSKCRDKRADVGEFF